MKKNVIVLISTIAILSGGCTGRGSQKEAIRYVKVDTVLAHGVKREVTFPGKVRAASDISLAFRVSGTLIKVNVDAGDYVRKGQILAELDPRDYEVQLAATQAQYNKIKNEAQRVIELYGKKSVSENEYDKAVFGLQQITSQYDAHKNALADTKLRAPFDGYVHKRVFNNNETVSAGMPILYLMSSGKPEVEINIPATEYIERESFESFTCTADIFPDRVFELHPANINPKANLNQRYNMRLRFISDDKNTMPSPGMAVMVSISCKQRTQGAASLPLTAIFEREGASNVWIYDPDSQTVAARKVRMSEILTDGSVVVSEGLSAGDIVVTAGVHAIEQGQKVKLLSGVSSTNVGGML